MGISYRVNSSIYYIKGIRVMEIKDYKFSLGIVEDICYKLEMEVFFDRHKYNDFKEIVEIIFEDGGYEEHIKDEVLENFEEVIFNAIVRKIEEDYPTLIDEISTIDLELELMSVDINDSMGMILDILNDYIETL
ncbi:hypothetical protein [Clostridium perfringens]|uniref:hypothetical protein n=1 Tax=Clostridium perfringens TaxID=1502 RepID=UPI0039EA22FC